jgi:hypothetical protein
MRSMQSSSQKTPRTERQRTGPKESRLLKNGARAHTFTREDRARGGHARAEKICRRKELKEKLDGAETEDLAAAESELLDRAVARLNLLIGSEDDRVALRAVKEVLDRTLGRPRQRHEHGRSHGADMDATLAAAREKLEAQIECRSQRDPRRATVRRQRVATVSGPSLVDEQVAEFERLRDGRERLDRPSAR